MEIIFDFTLNKIGGFQIGEGEFFSGEFLTKTDFIIIAKETKRNFYLYFYPNGLYKKYKSSTDKWCEEWIEMSTNYGVQIYGKKKLTNYFLDLLSGKTKNKSIYQPCSDVENTFIVNDFWFYYANECEHKEVLIPMKNMNRTNRMIKKYLS